MFSLIRSYFSPTPQQNSVPRPILNSNPAKDIPESQKIDLLTDHYSPLPYSHIYEKKLTNNCRQIHQWQCDEFRVILFADTSSDRKLELVFEVYNQNTQATVHKLLTRNSYDELTGEFHSIRRGIDSVKLFNNLIYRAQLTAIRRCFACVEKSEHDDGIAVHLHKRHEVTCKPCNYEDDSDVLVNIFCIHFISLVLLGEDLENSAAILIEGMEQGTAVSNCAYFKRKWNSTSNQFNVVIKVKKVTLLSKITPVTRATTKPAKIASAMLSSIQEECRKIQQRDPSLLGKYQPSSSENDTYNSLTWALEKLKTINFFPKVKYSKPISYNIFELSTFYIEDPLIINKGTNLDPCRVVALATREGSVDIVFQFAGWSQLATQDFDELSTYARFVEGFDSSPLENAAKQLGEVDEETKVKFLRSIPIKFRIGYFKDHDAIYEFSYEFINSIPKIKLKKIMAHSQLNTPNIFLDRDHWAVTLVTRGEGYGHALIAIEGIEEGCYFIKYLHLRADPNVSIEVCNGPDICKGIVHIYDAIKKDLGFYQRDRDWNLKPHLKNMNAKTLSWKRTALVVTKMIKAAQDQITLQQQGQTPVYFCLFGRNNSFAKILIGNQYQTIKPHNCLTWAIETLKHAGIHYELDEGILLPPTPRSTIKNLRVGDRYSGRNERD